MHFSHEFSFSSWRFFLSGWVQAASHATASLRGHMALAAQCTLRVAQTQPGQQDLCTEPPAALLQLLSTSTGQIMPYHKVAVKTGLSLDSPSESPAPQPVRQRLFGVCRAACWHAAGGSEILETAWRLPAATPGGQGAGDAGNRLQSC